MINECQKCGENDLECVCNDQEITTTSPFPVELAASIIKRNLEETQLTIAFDMLEKAGMLDEFVYFFQKRKKLYILDVMSEFAKLHPDKFSTPEETESYGTHIVISKQSNPS